jgi:NitT/TauT family transport system ATP-binding protein
MVSDNVYKIRIDELGKAFLVKGQYVNAVANVNLLIPTGQFVCLVGPSGCGKSTLLRIIGGLDQQTEGELQLYHENPDKPLNSIVFQEQSIFPWMTVKNNIAYGLQMRRASTDEIRDKTEYYLDKIGLRKFASSYPFQLSGGMKQRVSVARAFANDPEILLMDEPFAALDEQNKILLQEELLRIWEGTRKTVVYITHSIDEAIVMADRIVVMTAHPGTIKAEIEVDLPRPRSVYQLKATPEFGKIVHQVWELLRDEVLRSKEQEVISVKNLAGC